MLANAGKQTNASQGAEALSAHRGAFTTGVDGAACVTFRLADPSHEAGEVRLRLDLGSSTRPRPMCRVGAGWELAVSGLPVTRLQYLFELRRPDGSRLQLCDPGNPHRVSTGFGDHSVVEFPSYRAPTWLTHSDDWLSTSIAVAASEITNDEITNDDGRPDVRVVIRSPAGAAVGDALPALLVHDGRDFAVQAALGRFCAAMIASGRLPAHRLVVLDTGDRGRWYAASEGYADALVEDVVPAIRAAVAVTGPLVLAGASLGALAALHACCRAPGNFGGLFLQSGSFLRRDTDAQESDFPGFEAVVRFVELLDGAGDTRTDTGGGIDIAMTCGLVEENLANNRLMARDLARRGHRVTLSEVPDAHNVTAWRDALDPHLADLLAAVWR